MVFLLGSYRFARVLLGIFLLRRVLSAALGWLPPVLLVRRVRVVHCGRLFRLLSLREVVLLVL